MRKVYWWFKVVQYSLRRVPRYNLGDIVVFRGKDTKQSWMKPNTEWVLTQGVKSPLWTLRDVQSGSISMEVHEDEFYKKKTISNYVGSFLSAYRFYMGYWYNIWVNFNSTRGAPL